MLPLEKYTQKLTISIKIRVYKTCKSFDDMLQ